MPSINFLIHSKSKKTYPIKSKTKLNLCHLFNAISKKEKMSSQKMMLIYKGKPIDESFEFDQLQPKSIVHLVSIDEVDKSEITVKVRMQSNSNQWKFIIASSATSRELASMVNAQMGKKQSEKLCLVYLGKVLNPLSKLRDSFVQDGSEIIGVDLLDMRNNLSFNNESRVMNRTTYYELPARKIKDKMSQTMGEMNQQTLILRNAKISLDQSKQTTIVMDDRSMFSDVFDIHKIERPSLSNPPPIEKPKQYKIQPFEQAVRKPLVNITLTKTGFLYAGNLFQPETQNFYESIIEEYKELFQ